jgi:hypothetical protein
MLARMPFLALAPLVFASAVLAQTAPATTPATTPADSRPILKVATVDEFLKALGPDRILELSAGTYCLSDAKRGVGANFKWQDALENQFELIIRNAPNLAIRGAGKEPAHLVTTYSYANVLTFQKCDRLELANLRIGHAVTPGYCCGGVIKASDSQALRVERCALYGSGIHGLDLQNVRQFTFVESIIEDCSYGLMLASECDGLRFEKSAFRQCQELYGFDFKDCTKVEWSDCTITDNAIGCQNYPLFKTNLSDKDLAMRFTGGVIRHNAAAALVSAPDMLVVENATVEGNAWQAAPQVKRARGTRLVQSNGAAVYTADLGDQSWETLAAKLFGNSRRASALRAANPLVREPIWPDTKIIVPRE